MQELETPVGEIDYHTKDRLIFTIHHYFAKERVRKGWGPDLGEPAETVWKIMEPYLDRYFEIERLFLERKGKK